MTATFKRNRESMNSTVDEGATVERSITDDVLNSLTQLSINQASPKEKKFRKLKHQSSNKQRIRKAKSKAILQSDQKSYLPDYLNVPNRTFKKMFMDASEYVIPMNQHSRIHKWLEISKNMQYIREYARLLDKLLYLQLKQSLWTDYYNVGTSVSEANQGVWASEVQEKMTREQQQLKHASSNCSLSIDPLSFVTHYRMNIDKQLENIENELNEHLNCFQKMMHGKEERSQVQAMHLSVIMKAFVRKGHHKLNAEFERKKRLLHFDYQDHQLTKAFFDLKPTKKQVC